MGANGASPARQTEALISVIIPVYKTEAYLRGCIESVLAQTHTNLEVILVDDGSPDRCGMICDEYARLDKRVKVIHKENGGASTAKNAGLEIATGEYIGFVDADDRIHPQMYEVLYYYAVTDGSDMVSTERYPTVQKECFNPETDGKDRLILTADEVLRKFCQEYYGRLWMSYQIKLFHKDVFRQLRFREGIIYEDTDLFPETVRLCRKITLIPLQLYYYTLSDDSVMRAAFSPKRYIMIDVWKRYVEFFAEQGLADQRDHYAVKYVYTLIDMYSIMSEQYPEHKQDFSHYIRGFKAFRPFLRKECGFSGMQRLLLEIFPGMPRLAVKIQRYLSR